MCDLVEKRRTKVRRVHDERVQCVVAGLVAERKRCGRHLKLKKFHRIRLKLAVKPLGGKYSTLFEPLSNVAAAPNSHPSRLNTPAALITGFLVRLTSAVIYKMENIVKVCAKKTVKWRKKLTLAVCRDQSAFNFPVLLPA